MPQVSQDEVLLLWRALRTFRSGGRPACAPHGLIAELSEAFRKNTWANRQEPPGPEMTAWRRAAAFLDGAVFCGGPVR